MTNGEDFPPVSGPARLADKDGRFPKIVAPGSVVVVDIADLDLNAAHRLVSMLPAAVLNAAACITGREMALGVDLLLDRGIPVVDDLGPDILAITTGQTLRVTGNEVWQGDTLVAEGNRVTVQAVIAREDAREEVLERKIEVALAALPTTYATDSNLLVNEEDLPKYTDLLRGRTALVAPPSAQTETTLGPLKRFVQEYQPVFIGVDSGANAFKQVRRKPDLVVGHPQDIPDKWLKKAKGVIAVNPGSAGIEKLDHLAVQARVVNTELSATDVALLVAQASGASVVVDGGAGSTLRQVMDQSTPEAASSLLVQAKMRDTLISGQAAKTLYRPGVPKWLLILLFIAAVAAGLSALIFTPFGDSLVFSNELAFGYLEQKPWGNT